MNESASAPRHDDGAHPLAVVTGASTGIGYELARCCAEQGCDLLIAADEARIEEAAQSLRQLGVEVTAVQADLATSDGVRRLVEAVQGRPVELLLANAGHGLGRDFLSQDFAQARHVVDTNVTGTLELLHALVGDMRRRGRGRVLITGSIAGFMPGSFQAVYNGTKAFVDSFAAALRNELKDSGVTVTCLMPGPTDTAFFERAGLMDTQVGQGAKDDPRDVAKTGFAAMMRGDASVVAGLKNRMRVAVSRVTPASVLAQQHRRMAEPGSAARGSSVAAVAAAAFAGLALAGVAIGWYVQQHGRPVALRWIRRYAR